jgi:DNA-directed RNA polymerase specialized sigma24 family protein
MPPPAAEILGIPVGTVRSRLARARKKLQAMVDAAGLSPGDRRQAAD